MWTFLSIILNLPWTILGFCGALVSIPKQFSFSYTPFALVVHVKSFWWYWWLPNQKGARAMALGNMVLISPNALDNDLEHELVHVAQSMREPLIHPFLYQLETARNGYRKNKYEMEAYGKAGNVYVHKMKLQPNPFGKIKDGSKTIEVRLNDEKRQLLNVGDEIEFSAMSDPEQIIRVKITNLFHYPTFSQLFDAFPATMFGGINKDDLMGIYKYYSKDEEAKYGVVGIQVKFIR